MVHQDSFTLATKRHGEIHGIDAEVRRIVSASGIRTGTAHIFHVGSTAVIATIELEPGLESDLPELLDRLIPPSRSYGHEAMWHDGNGHSHLQATLMGPSLTVPVKDGAVVQGTWQQLIHIECDIKPRQRTVMVTVQGE